ncbi:MAG: N-acetylmuramic acid 6-phosphate etherase [Sphingobacteriales bacterium]|jgi:N-acetylmuramic acid 6-phosphate etherase
MHKTTESSSEHTNLDKLGIEELTILMNQFDAEVHVAVHAEIISINASIKKVVNILKNGGRLFYIGAGTSGRLGILDASECPPTFGVSDDVIVGLIAGGDMAIRKAVEFAEDDTDQAWKDLAKHNISDKDMVIGIAASGSTPYVIGGLETCQANGVATGCITCNKNSPVQLFADYPIAVEVGPELITGSTRLKAGTAQKLVLNMISTIAMIKLGKVSGNKMVNMQLSNHKLIERGINMILDQYPKLDRDRAKTALIQAGSVKIALEKLA